jgi:phospholipid/cholesterol/gamma-HCH transport system substrate-binding protein
MARNNRTYVVGVFVAGIAVIVVIVLLWLTGSRFLRPVDRYQVVFKGSVSGLLPGGAVELEGVTVGKVVDIRLTHDSPPRVVVDIEVRPGTPIRRNTLATLSGSLVTGIQFVALSGGTEQAGELPQGDSITAQQRSFEDIRNKALDLTDQTRQALSSINRVLDKDNTAALKSLIQDLSATAHNLRTVTGDLTEPARLHAINTTVDNLREASERLNHTAQRAGTLVDSLTTKAPELASEATSAFKRLNQTLAGAQHLIATTDALLSRSSGDLDTTLHQINHVSRHLDETIQTIQAEPSVLLFGNRVPVREER